MDFLFETLKKNRGISNDSFFESSIEDLHDPYLMPDMEKAVQRILEARERKERIVIFWDYDVDGVSSTAILVRYLTEIGCLVSYRLPHRVHDGYGLKDYFFDELASKNVKLVITVDCGTRDIGPIRYAKSLGIDVIVTDHHAVPEVILDEVIALLNPKRKDSLYPFRDLAGAGVAFKLLHALVIAIEGWNRWNGESEGATLSEGRWEQWQVEQQQSESEFVDPSWAFGTFQSWKVQKILKEYIDFASLGTVADCMPIIWENRVITTLGLRQMSQSKSQWLRKFLNNHNNRNSQKRSNSSENQIPKWIVSGNTVNEDVKIWTWSTSFSEFLDADIIGFQIGPRINAAGRMDTPITALQWLLAGEWKTDGFFEELEHLNETRKGTTEHHLEKALQNVDTSKPILFYDAEDLEHGIIGLVAGKLTEMYGKPSIVLKNGSKHPLTSRKGDEVSVEETENSKLKTLNSSLSIASCRSPEWCSIIELLESCKEYFIRFGGHRQAAGFTIETSKIDELKSMMYQKFSEIHDIENLPKKTMEVECILDPETDFTLENIAIIDRFRPFGIGNRKPLFLLQDQTILECTPLGKEGKHLQIRLGSNTKVKLVAWGWGKANEEWRMKNEEWKTIQPSWERALENTTRKVALGFPSWGVPTKGGGVEVPDYANLLQPGNIVSLIVELDRNEWNGRESVSVVVKELVTE